MVYRVFVEKKPALANEARALLSDARNLLGMTGLERVRILNRYDAENIDPALFEYAKRTVFSEPQTDLVTEAPDLDGAAVFAVEYLPGQFDMRADSAAQCIQIISCGERPTVRSAKVYALYGALTEAQLAELKRYVINPVEAREAAMEKPATLAETFPTPDSVDVLTGFTALDRTGLAAFCASRGLAMDTDDLALCRDYFAAEGRDPTITEIRVIDTYWSDHCRHTTFHTDIDSVAIEDAAIAKTYARYRAVRSELGRTAPENLMDIATLAAKYLKKQGLLDKLDESAEINACTVRITVTVDGRPEPWLLLFKNETHNHPTEIEPFGGAATCIGGAIRDPLSGRSYVYAAMRVTGSADPTGPIADTLRGKLPQRKIAQTAAAGYSSYGNQIGLATGLVNELYHPGYAAKHMEIGAVLGAAPAANVRRETPEEGDVVILLGGRTGRDGIGGATGSSKAHTQDSVARCGAEVQKGNAPEERKLQRLFRNAEACRMIKRCNDFGAGGVSVAIGELADGLAIELDAVPKKYEGLDGTELAISESQERMAVVVAGADAARFAALADAENLEATVVAAVTAEPRLRMRWKGRVIVDISRAFLDSNGARKHTAVAVPKPRPFAKKAPAGFRAGYEALLADLNVCSARGLAERFDSTIGAGTVLMPFGGRHQRTPIQAMVHKLPVEQGHTDDCSFMAWGFDPYITEKSPYHGAYLAVVESLSKLIAAGASFEDVYLSFQEYFGKVAADPVRWGKPFAALLGAFQAQLDYGVAAIGGKDSMSGSFESLDVPPTLVSFAVTTGRTGDVVSPEFKAAGHKVIRVAPLRRADGLPDADSQRKCFAKVTELMRDSKVYAAATPASGGIAEAVYKMCIGNGLGFRFADGEKPEELFAYAYGSFLLEVDEDTAGQCLGRVTDDGAVTLGGESLPLAALDRLYESRLEDVYPTMETNAGEKAEAFSFRAESYPAPAVKTARPRVVIPVFPGTNCEYDSARAMRDAGAEPEIFVVNNLTAEGIARSVDAFAASLQKAQMVFIPGGFSGGDEPDGSGKFITAFFRNGAVRDGVTALLDERGGLMCGICNGFQALIKLGLVPYGRIIDADESCPTLTFNTIGRHQSRLVRTRVASNKSPWLSLTRVGEVYTVPISHGEGRFLADEALIRELGRSGQIATQYADLDGEPSMDMRYNPNGSLFAVEGITSPDGRVFGKMGHSERTGAGLYQNVDGRCDMPLFTAAVRFFR